MLLQDTGDTRETPAIDVCKGLIGDGAKLNVYDPQVALSPNQLFLVPTVADILEAPFQ